MKGSPAVDDVEGAVRWLARHGGELSSEIRPGRAGKLSLRVRPRSPDGADPRTWATEVQTHESAPDALVRLVCVAAEALCME